MEHSELAAMNNPTLRMRSYSATRDGAPTTKENGVDDDYHDNGALENDGHTVNDIDHAQCSHFENRPETCTDSERILQNVAKCYGIPTEASKAFECSSVAKELLQPGIEEITKDSKDLNFRDWTKEQFIVCISYCLTNLLSYLSLTVLASFFPLEANKKGLTNTISGWIFGVFPLVMMFASPAFGYLGIVEVFAGIGLIAGPALGGALYTAGGFFTPFGVIAAGWCVAIPLVWYFIPRQDDTLKEESLNLSWKSFLCNPKTLVNSLALVVSAIVPSVLDPTLEPHLRVFGIEPAIVGLLFLIMGVTYSLTSPLWGRIADRVANVRSLIMVSLVVCAVGMLLVGPSPLLGFQLSFNELWLTVVSLVIIGVGSSMSMIPTCNVYVEILTELGYPEDTKTYGIISGLWLSMFGLGDFLGPTVGGLLSDEIGFEWLTTATAGICIFTVIVIGLSWFIETKLRVKPKQESCQVITPSGDHPYQTLN